VADETDPLLYHFTHISHLESILTNGIFSDTRAQAMGLITHEAGDQGVKERRRSMTVPIEPGGVVADYVPYYFAPRSPMLLRIMTNRVPSYTGARDELIYLPTRVSTLTSLGLQPIFTRRNAALLTAEFFDDPAELATNIDWPLMKERYWNDTPTDGDRMHRRMAECLVHDHVPPDAIIGLAAMSGERVYDVEVILDRIGFSLSVVQRPSWYY